MNSRGRKSVFGLICLLFLTYPSPAEGRISARWDEKGPDQGSLSIRKGNLRLEVKTVRESLVPVAGFQSEVFALGPLAPAGALALERAWGQLRPESDIWNQSPFWTLSALPRSWTHAGAFLGRKGGPGGAYLRWDPDSWVWGAFFTGIFGGGVGTFRVYLGTEGACYLPPDPWDVPYGEPLEDPQDQWKTKAGVVWQTGPLSFQTWGWTATGEYFPPRWSGVLLGVWRDVPWNFRVLALGQSAGDPGRQAFLAGSLERTFSSGTLGASASVESVRDRDTSGLLRVVWTAGIRASAAEEYRKVSLRGELSGEEGAPWSLSGELEGEAGWEVLQGFAAIRPSGEYLLGLKSRCGPLVTRAGWTGDHLDLRVQGTVIPFEVSTRVLWPIPGNILPKTWEITFSLGLDRD